MKFDWYQGTLPAKPDLFFGEFVGRVACDVEQARPEIRQFTNGADLVRSDGSRIAHCCWGGVNGDLVHIKATGGEAPVVSGVVRSMYPCHKVSRVDVAVDYDESGAWDSLSRYLMDIATRHGVDIDNRGDWYRGDEGKGRTVYIGAVSSNVRVRVYEKGKEQSFRGVTGCSPYWVRAEVQVRPKGSSKGVAALMQPVDFWGSSSWCREFGDTMFKSGLQRVDMAGDRRLTDDEASLVHMLKQYGGVLQRLVGRRGWRSVQKQIGEVARSK